MAFLITDNGPGNVHESASYCNQMGFAPFVLSIHYNSGHHSTILMRADTYAQYKLLCEKMRRTPVSEEEFNK